MIQLQFDHLEEQSSSTEEEEEDSQTQASSNSESNDRQKSLDRADQALKKAQEVEEEDDGDEFPIFEDFMPTTASSNRSEGENSGEPSSTEQSGSPASADKSDAAALLRELLLQSLSSGRSGQQQQTAAGGSSSRGQKYKKLKESKELTSETPSPQAPSKVATSRAKRKLSGLNKNLESLSKKIAQTLESL
jgi:hypothetical protein